jgi:hypothetical protein
MKPKRNSRYLILVLIVIIMNGCATPPKVAKMIPNVDYSAFTSTDKTIRIQEVYGGELADPMGTFKIESNSFQEALVTTLRESSIFKDVFLDRGCDYELKTQIVSQKITSWLGSTRVTLFVHYGLFETKTNKELWRESILSRYDTDISIKVASDRGAGEIEGAVRDNLTQLLNKLADLMNKLNKR